MQLIIDVDENLVCEGFERPFTEEEKATLIRAIGNGISYNSSGDLISREALKKAIGKSTVTIDGYEGAVFLFLDRVCDIIDNAPPVEAYTGIDLIEENKKGFNTARRLYERPKGEWIYKPNWDNIHQTRTCNKCGYCEVVFPNEADNFCPNCGVDMRGGAE